MELEPGDEGYQEPEPKKPEPEHQKFDDNLAKVLEYGQLSKMAQDLCFKIDQDKQGRDKWIKTYRDSLKYLGIENQTRSEPWENACAIVHPGMLQGIVRFQSRALGKLFPQQGPAALAVKGMQVTPQLQLIINQAQEMFNLHITDTMVETQTETDRLLFGLAQIGFAAKEVYYDDDQLDRVCTQYVAAENFILPYGADNIETCPRFTRELRLFKNDIENLIEDGKYLDLSLDAMSMDEKTDIEEAKAKLTGLDEEQTEQDSYHFYEVYVDLKIEDDEYGSKNKRSPYVVTIDRDNERVFRISRNWRKDDPNRKRRVTHALYRYVPGDGSYGFGLAHLVGQLIMGATRILRQLIDAGELSNLPGMIKSNAARMHSQSPIAPGELRDVDLPPEDIQKAFYPLPFKEPSQVLMALLELLIGEIKDFSSTAYLDISASSQNAPVGTTLALIEKQTEISNAVQKRMHTSFSQELKLIFEFLKEYEESKFEAIFGPLLQAIEGKGVLVICASGDPSSSTMAQRVMQLQAVLQNSAQAPQVYDLPVLHRSMITAMGLSDALSIVPDNTQIQPMGPVEEVQALLTSKPVQAFAPQDHQAHIQVLMSFMTDPMYQQIFAKAPNAQQILGSTMSLIAEHVAFEYRNEIEQQLGVQLPPPGEPLPPEIDQMLSRLVAQAAGRVAQQHASMAQQMASQQQAADPAYQLEKEELDLKKASEFAKHTQAAAKLQAQQENDDFKNKLEFLKVVTDAGKHSEQLTSQEMQSALDFDHRGQEVAADIGSKLLDHAQHLDNLDLQHKQADLQHQQHLNDLQVDQQ